MLKGKALWRGISWTRPASLHLTLKFLGEVGEGQLGAIEEALAGAASGIYPLTITAGKVGAFPSLKAPRVVWAGIQASEGLGELQKNIDERLAPLGFAPEARDYHPHLTICRVKVPSEGRELGGIITRMAPEINESWVASSFALYRSVLGPAGARYTVLKRIDLKGL